MNLFDPVELVVLSESVELAMPAELANLLSWWSLRCLRKLWTVRSLRVEHAKPVEIRLCVLISPRCA